MIVRVGDLDLTTTQQRNLHDLVSDLQVQAMVFDMDIDWETLTLTPKTDYIEPFWITRWKEKEHGSDRDNSRDHDQE
jgi:hypothetical protein